MGEAWPKNSRRSEKKLPPSLSKQRWNLHERVRVGAMAGGLYNIHNCQVRNIPSQYKFIQDTVPASSRDIPHLISKLYLPTNFIHIRHPVRFLIRPVFLDEFQQLIKHNLVPTGVEMQTCSSQQALFLGTDEGARGKKLFYHRKAT